MDTEFAKTFLAVVDTGSFVKAAERVHLTQSTVSMRIKALEDQIGSPLFSREKGGVVLTPQGVKFQRYASTLVRTWEQARMELSLPDHYRSLVRIGSQFSIWDGFLLRWLQALRQDEPDLALSTHVGFSGDLMDRLVEGAIDFAIMYRPDRFPGLEVEALFEDKLVLVSSAGPDAALDAGSYVFVDWGPQFTEDHNVNFPELAAPGLAMDIGALALRYVLDVPAFGYFPERMIGGLCEDGAMVRVPGAPVFNYPVYAARLTASAEPDVETVLQSLRAFVADGTFS